VALTFDAEHPDRSGCPAGNADSIFDVLVAEGVRTSVFIQGRWAQAYPDTAKRIAADGHLIGNHSHHHAEMPLSIRGPGSGARSAPGTTIRR
jgi:peptidoglycan/xylan/chitin deacetylase (PgdA/CDA1 family)